MEVTKKDVVDAIEQAGVVDDVSTLVDDIALTDQGTDSLGIFNVILTLQEKYDYEIPDEDVDSLNTINEIVTYLNHKLG